MNENEIPSADILETIVNQTKPEKKHTSLLKALSGRTNLKTIRHSRTYDGISQETGIYDHEHNLVATDARDWMREKLAEEKGNAYDLWNKYKDNGYLLATCDGSHEYFTMPYGGSADSFIQVEVYQWNEFLTNKLFNANPWREVETIDDLITGSACGRGGRIDRVSTGRVFYEFHKIIDASSLIERYNIAFKKEQDKTRNLPVKKFNYESKEWGICTYEEKFPDILRLPSNPVRFIQDWSNSSAGLSGARLCDHWVLHNTEWTDANGKENISIVPYWATAKPIKKIEYKKSMTAYLIYDLALKVDHKSGYPFAWFFYMLHGNRIGEWFGVAILEAAEAGLIFLAENDYSVLKRWHNYKYGF